MDTIVQIFFFQSYRIFQNTTIILWQWEEADCRVTITKHGLFTKIGGIIDSNTIIVVKQPMMRFHGTGNVRKYFSICSLYSTPSESSVLNIDRYSNGLPGLCFV